MEKAKVKAMVDIIPKQLPVTAMAMLPATTLKHTRRLKKLRRPTKVMKHLLPKSTRLKKQSQPRKHTTNLTDTRHTCRQMT